ENDKDRAASIKCDGRALRTAGAFGSFQPEEIAVHGIPELSSDGFWMKFSLKRARVIRGIGQKVDVGGFGATMCESHVGLRRSKQKVGRKLLQHLLQTQLFVRHEEHLSGPNSTPPRPRHGGCIAQQLVQDFSRTE